MKDKGENEEASEKPTRQARRLVKAAVRLCEPYAGPGGAVIAAISRDKAVTSGMWADAAITGQRLSNLIASMVHAANQCLEQGEFTFRLKLTTVKLQGDNSSVLD